MKSENTSIRLKRIMEDRQLRQIDILNLAMPYCEKYNVKMNKSDISQYVSGSNEPSQKKLVVLGMALGVSEAWLMGLDVPMERKTSGIIDTSELASMVNRLRTDENAQLLLKIYYNDLSPDNQKRILDLAIGLSGY